MKTAYATIRGFEIMRMFKKGQFNVWMYGDRNEVSFINQIFGSTAEIYSKKIDLCTYFGFCNGAR